VGRQVVGRQCANLRLDFIKRVIQGTTSIYAMLSTCGYRRILTSEVTSGQP
jgi:hypothetical protein